MLKYDIELFIEHYSYKIGKLNPYSAEGLRFVLGKLGQSTRLNTPGEHAYTLATVKWETADTFHPITEYGSEKYLKSKKYYPYIGRGYPMLTWLENYRRFGDALGIDLVNFPSKANHPEVAWAILEMGMTDIYVPQTLDWIKDPNFTSYTLNDFINEKKTDFKGARKVINPGDKKTYEPIAELAEKFHWVITKNIVDEMSPVIRK